MELETTSVHHVLFVKRYGNNIRRLAWALVILGNILSAEEQIFLPRDAALSPDGKQLALAWNGDIWTVSSGGGLLRQVTTSPARESNPKFSPDGKSFAFISDRSGANQVYRMSLQGGEPQQLTFHTEGCSLEDWCSDGRLLIWGSRDHFWKRADRFFFIDNKPRAPERLVFDAYGMAGRVSPDGKTILFQRDGSRWWRKGYKGSRAGQIWQYNIASGAFTQQVREETGSRTPIWHPDSKQFYYVSAKSGAYNLWRKALDSDDAEQLTFFKEDSVFDPSISANGRHIVFRHLFDFYRYDTKQGGKPRRLKLVYRGDQLRDPIVRRIVDRASEAVFSKDGLEVAFISGGDLWAMDTVLCEPRQITNTPPEERHPVFSPDGNAILYVSDGIDGCHIWRAERKNPDKFWWQNNIFARKQITKESADRIRLSWSPDGSQIAFVQGRGDLWVIKPNGEDASKVVDSWNTVDYDWSPDGKWIVYARSNNDFNRDIFLLPLDGSRKPFNISRHPDNDYRPIWSPNGKMIAFTGRRVGEEIDIHFVHLQKSEDDEGSRDRKFKEAIEKIEKVRKKKPDEKPTDKSKESDKKPGENAQKKLPEVVIDFKDISQRIRRVSISGVEEEDLFWSHDSKRLAFNAIIKGKRGTYTISPPDELEPKLLSTVTGSNPRWIERDDQILWLSEKIPASLTGKGKATTFKFSAQQAYDKAARNATVFTICWRVMRDHFYDGNLNNRDWDAVFKKYIDAARNAPDTLTFSTVVHLMLGELNGSHLGFNPKGLSTFKPGAWQEMTAHLGVRFDSEFAGPGMKIRDVIQGGPADKTQSLLTAGDILLSIDGEKIGPDNDLTTLLNGNPDRDIALHVKNQAGDERDVTIRPIKCSTVRSLLYDQWIDSNQAVVAKLSDNRFGYVHIRGMNMTSFYKFEREIYQVAAGKDGLVIDVRENSGGFTTDHLLTMLTQPVHAITVPRGGGPGYPQDRKVYATWNKPVVVLCNQYSFSNAEIFTHAVKTLKRGQVVGVPTAGGVISTGRWNIMDAGYLRKPFRGWYLAGDGEDMELNGAVPNHILWPEPGEIPSGVDQQLQKAVQVLVKEVKRWQSKPTPKILNASERRRKSKSK